MRQHCPVIGPKFCSFFPLNWSAITWTHIKNSNLTNLSFIHTSQMTLHKELNPKHETWIFVEVPEAPHIFLLVCDVHGRQQRPHMTNVNKQRQQLLTKTNKPKQVFFLLIDSIDNKRENIQLHLFVIEVASTIIRLRLFIHDCL